MKTKKKYFFLFILGIGTILFQFSNLNQVLNQSEKSQNTDKEKNKEEIDDQVVVQEQLLANPAGQVNIENVVNKEEELIITMAVCGVGRINESIVLMKSAVFFSKIKLRFIIFADEIANETLHDAVNLKVRKAALSSRHVFEIRKMQFPTEQGINWKSMFRPCSCQRLFLPVSKGALFKLNNN